MKRIAAVIVALTLCTPAIAQNFKAQQRAQEKVIEKTYKKHKITELEYNKLMREQDIIKATIRKYEADHYLDPHEKNVIHDKLERAEKRLRRYKTNSEIY